MTKFKWPAFVLLFAILDQLSKYWVVRALPLQEPVELIPFLGFYRTYNEGIAFSLLSWVNDWVQAGFIVLVIGFVIWLWRNLAGHRPLSSVGYALILGGAFGNLVDRVLLGKVVDFIWVHTESWSFAIFNLADSFVTVGAAAIILDEIIHARKASGRDNAAQESDNKEQS